MQLELVFRGVRGTLSACGPHVLHHGGHTTCAEVRLGPDHRLLLDCGTGLAAVGDELLAHESGQPMRFDVLLTHYHRDHIEGLPLFPQLYDARNQFTFYGYPAAGLDVRRALESVLQPPWFPVPLTETPAEKSYVDLMSEPFTVGPLQIRSARLRHPQGVTAYRLEHAGRAVVFATDTEYGDPQHDAALRSLAHKADVLIHDAQYTPEEYEAYRGQGHSTWRHAVEVARDSQARHLVFFHHAPERSDDELRAIVAAAREEFPSIEAAREGAAVPL